MARNALTIRQMGESACWLVVQQALGMPDIKMNSNFMDGKVALLLFGRQSLPERLCCTAAMRQMGGTTIYEVDNGSAEWRKTESRFQTHLLPIFGYYLDVMYIYGVKLPAPESIAHLKFPLINAGGGDAHPVHAMADMACILKTLKKHDKYGLEGIKTAWIGCDNGTLYSLIEAMPWFPFSLKVSLPPRTDIAPLAKRAKELKVSLEFCATPEEAVKGARFIYAGRRDEREEDSAWSITPGLMSKAAPDAKLLLSASPIRAILIAPTVLSGSASLLPMQSELRLAVHKRLLHWVFATS